MKSLTTLFIATIIILFSTRVNAQWATSGNNIYNTNSGFVGIGTSSPTYLLDVAKNITGPSIAIRNLGGVGGAGFSLIDQISNSHWKIKTTSIGALKFRDDASALNVMLIERNAAENSLYIKAGGNVGIGTSVPGSLLEVAKNTIGPAITIHNLGGIGGAGFIMTDDLSGGNWKFKTTSTGGFKIRDHGNGLDVLVMESNSTANAIYVKAGGNVGIGTANPTSKLAVNGKIDCKEVEIYIDGWSDCVFGNDYKLRSLKEVETYINQNHHLPDVPSEKEVLENGVNVGEMNSILLKKVEELTLYMIELKKENELMKKDNKVMKVQIEKLMY